MSYLSTSENVGFSGITQNISDASCATQYKMAVEGVSGNCGGEVNMYINDSSGDEQYIPHLSDNFFHTKFKIDPNELYTFHDSDVIAGEITVSHTEDNFIFPETVDIKTKLLDSPNKDLDLLSTLSNGDIKEVKAEVVTNGHYTPISKVNMTSNKETKTLNTKAPKTKNQTQTNHELSRTKIIEIRRPSIHSPKGQNNAAQTLSNKVSINNINNASNSKTTSVSKSASETFLDVFKREQGLIESTAIKIEPATPPPPKAPAPAVKKVAPVKTPQSKPKRGRGPTVHEALQRIPAQRKVIAVPNRPWHAPGEEMFKCGPLDGRQTNPFRQLESSSSDDDNMPDFESGSGAMCVEESAAESRGARLALRRAAMRRHVARAATELQLTKGHKEHRALAHVIKKQLCRQSTTCHLPAYTVNHLLAMRGMSTILTVQERRLLRESGWSGGDACRVTSSTCAEDSCTQQPLPCGRHCLTHVTLAPEQRLYAACAAVFTGGERCKQPLLPLQEQTPLCPEHAWKRDNYELLSCRPAKGKKRAWPAARPRPPRRPKRRRRLLPRRPPPHTQSLSEINVCSNSSAYDSSEDAAVGGLSETEYIAANNSHELEVGQVPPDDILDPSVLSQIPDEEFTEFFNQAEGGAPFAESSELAAALEAVLDERALDNIAECVFTSPHSQSPHTPQSPLSPQVKTKELDERALNNVAECVFTQSPHSQSPYTPQSPLWPQIKTKLQVTPITMELSSSISS